MTTKTVEIRNIPTPERLEEMYKKLSEFGKNVSHETDKVAGGTLHTSLLRLDVTIPEALIQLGIAKDEVEAEAFIASTIVGGMVAGSTGQVSGNEVMYGLMQLGFFIGTLSARKDINKEVVN